MDHGYNYLGGEKKSPQSMKGLPGFPGFIVIPTFKNSQGIPSSHPDKIYVESPINLSEEINKVTTKLKEIETVEYRCKSDKDTISEERKKYTVILKSLLKLKD